MLASALIKTGILQFGLFGDSKDNAPYIISLQSLPSHPKTCALVASMIAAKIDPAEYDRIVAPQQSSVLAGIVSQSIQVPLVYHLGRGGSPIHDWVGSYDVGHPACLILNQSSEATDKLIKECAQVGLQISQIIAVIGDTFHHAIMGVPITVIAQIDDILSDLQSDGHLSSTMRESIMRYQTKRAL